MIIKNWLGNVLVASEVKRIAAIAPLFANSVEQSPSRSVDLIDFEAEVLRLMAISGLSFRECDIRFDQWRVNHPELDWREAMTLLRAEVTAGRTPGCVVC